MFAHFGLPHRNIELVIKQQTLINFVPTTLLLTSQAEPNIKTIIRNPNNN